MGALFCTSKTNPSALRQVRLAPSRPQSPSFIWVPFWCPSRFIRVCNRPQTTTRDICHTDAAWVATVAVHLKHFLSILHKNITFELPRHQNGVRKVEKIVHEIDHDICPTHGVGGANVVGCRLGSVGDPKESKRAPKRAPE